MYFHDADFAVTEDILRTTGVISDDKAVITTPGFSGGWHVVYTIWSRGRTSMQ